MRCIISIQDISLKNNVLSELQIISYVVKYAYIFKIHALAIECDSLHLNRHTIFFFHPRVIFGVR